jgi:hypothetical protein
MKAMKAPNTETLIAAIQLANGTKAAVEIAKELQLPRICDHPDCLDCNALFIRMAALKHNLPLKQNGIKRSAAEVFKEMLDESEDGFFHAENAAIGCYELGNVGNEYDLPELIYEFADGSWLSYWDGMLIAEDAQERIAILTYLREITSEAE